MLLAIIRTLFILIVAGVAMNYVELTQSQLALGVFIIALGAACLVIALDVFIPQKSLLALSGLFFGLVVGMLVTYGIGLILDLFVESYRFTWATESLVGTTKMLIGVIACYLAVSFILQTKDDVRFVIPYVEFAKQRKGGHPLILDTSAIIDGRIADILDSWAVDVPVVIPRFVLAELQAVADSSDKLKRNRGRRGLDVVNRLQVNEKLDIQFHEPLPGGDDSDRPVDERLLSLALHMDGRIVTTDYNLNKVATIRGVDVININDLANSLKPVFLPGERMRVKIIRAGESVGQGVGYLDDGTMVVVETARDRIGEMVPVVVTSVLQTSAGRMVFGRINGDGGAASTRPPRPGEHPT